MDSKPPGVRRRLDFKIIPQPAEPGDAPNVVRFGLAFDTQRYDWIEQGGERFLIDKLQEELIPEAALLELVGRFHELPLYHQPQAISHAVDYVQSRAEAIRQGLSGNSEAEPPNDGPSARFLESRAGTELYFAILSVDLIGSTSLASALEPDKYARLIAVFSDEISRIVPLFRGEVLKYTGDGILAYFPEPSFLLMNDLAVDCALTIRRLVVEGLNPAFGSQGYPIISVRIGLEAGDAFVKVIGDPSTKRQSDIIGATVGIATKVQALAAPNSIVIGDAMLTLLHTDWRLRTRPMETGSSWTLRARDGASYKVHELLIADAAQ